MKIALLAALLAAFCVVGAMDYDDALLQQAEYCEKVAAGTWPDYQGTFKQECSK